MKKRAQNRSACVVGFGFGVVVGAATRRYQRKERKGIVTPSSWWVRYSWGSLCSFDGWMEKVRDVFPKSLGVLVRYWLLVIGSVRYI